MTIIKYSPSSSPPDNSVSSEATSSGGLAATPQNTTVEPLPKTGQVPLSKTDQLPLSKTDQLPLPTTRQLPLPTNFEELFGPRSKPEETLSDVAVSEVHDNSTKLNDMEKANGKNADDDLKTSDAAKTSIPDDVDGLPSDKCKTEETLLADKGVRFQGNGEGEKHNHDEMPSQGAPSLGTKKKNKKKKPKRQRGLNAPTGFEEYYVDAPLTPAEFAEERDLYDTSNSFIVRIETAIQRYRARRNMNSDKKNLFDKWLTFGGVDSSPRQFTGGLDAQLLRDSTAEQIAAFTAVNFVNDDLDFEGPDARYEVDFDGVVKSFLTSRLENQFDCSTKDKIEGWCNIIKNFLNYLLHHDVCPEYQHQIYAARDSCTLAAQQIWKCHEANTSLPGDFNVACSTLFGGFYYDTYNEAEQTPPGSGKSMFGMSKDHARQVFEFALAAHCDDALFNRYQTQVSANQVTMQSLGEIGMEVAAIELPSEEIQHYYANLPTLEPSGILRVKSWKIPGTEATMDLTPEERLAQKNVKELVKYHEFWAEEAVLKKIFLGMKFIATVREMSFGVLYMDNCLGSFCNFFEVLPNELMLKHRAFKYLEPRPKEVYDEDLENYKLEQAAPPNRDEDEEDEAQEAAHVELDNQELKGKAKANEESEILMTTNEKTEIHNDNANGNQAVSTSDPPRQKWHYEEINGELCFVPYEEPASDYESSVDDDDKVDTLVNNHTGKTAHHWPAQAWYNDDLSSDTEHLVLNPDTDPATGKLDTWAKQTDPTDSANHDYDSPPSEDDDEPRLGEYVLKSGMTASLAALDLASRPADPRTPVKPLREPHRAGPTESEDEAEPDEAEPDEDTDIDLSPQTTKHRAVKPLFNKHNYRKDSFVNRRGEERGRLSPGDQMMHDDSSGDEAMVGEETSTFLEDDGENEVVEEDGGTGPLEKEMQNDDTEAAAQRLTPFLQKTSIEDVEDKDD